MNVGGYYKTSESRAQVCAPFVFLSESLNLDFFSSCRAFRGREREEEEMRRRASRAGSRGRGGEEEREIVAVPLLPASCEQGREIRTPPPLPLHACMYAELHVSPGALPPFRGCVRLRRGIGRLCSRQWGRFFSRREEEM